MTLFLRLAEGLACDSRFAIFRHQRPKALARSLLDRLRSPRAITSPAEVAAFLGERGIFTWDGNYYALNLTERLGVEANGGLLRIGLVHYNTAEEVDRLLAALREI